MPKKQSKSKSRKPLTISIHGEGIDIDAKINSRSDLDAITSSLAEKLMIRGSALPGPTVAPAPEPHDFDIVKTVIEHGDPVVLQAIVDLAMHKLEQHRAAS